MRYEPNNPAIEIEMTPLNAVALPMLTNDSTMAMAEVSSTAYRGIPVRRLVCLRNVHPGRPRSRAKAQYSREVDAIQPVVALKDMTMTIAAMTAAPAVDPTAFLKMAIKGY